MTSHRRFHMNRTVHVTGTSGTGTVAEGIQYTSGHCVIEWTCEPASSICIYASLDELLKIHGHGGATTIEWLDDGPEEGIIPCPLGLHDPQDADEDGYAPYDGCPDCDELATTFGLTHGELEEAARQSFLLTIPIEEAIRETA